jgi:hypothetical protein
MAGMGVSFPAASGPKAVWRVSGDQRMKADVGVGNGFDPSRQSRSYEKWEQLPVQSDTKPAPVSRSCRPIKVDARSRAL